MALACNISAAVFGGTAPMLLMWLINQTGDKTIVAAYIVLIVLISLTALWRYKETYRVALNR